MPARADAVVVIAAHFCAVPVEVDEDRSMPAALRARPPMAIRREVGRLDGRGQAAREARDEVEPSDERFGHQKSMRHLRSVLQRGASAVNGEPRPDEPFIFEARECDGLHRAECDGRTRTGFVL